MYENPFTQEVTGFPNIPQAVVPVLVLLFVALWFYSTRRFVLSIYFKGLINALFVLIVDQGMPLKKSERTRKANQSCFG